ncbi:(2Fe-2S)-binding protein [Amycolatopsis stemonae]
MSQQRSSRATREVGDGLASSLLRVSGLRERPDLRRDVPPGWIRCSELLETPAYFAEWRDLLAGSLQASYGAAPARTTAAWVLTWYLYVPAHVGALLLHHERRVPSLKPAELAFRLADDGPHPAGTAVLGTAFHCLPTDPGSARPEATAVRDERALAAVLRARYVAHATQFVRAYAPVSRLGPRALWAAATDALDNALWWAGGQGGTPEAEGAGVADAALVLDERYPPLTSASTLRLAENREWTRRRESCCFSYLLPGEPECDGCPRTCPR